VVELTRKPFCIGGFQRLPPGPDIAGGNRLRRFVHVNKSGAFAHRDLAVIRKADDSGRRLAEGADSRGKVEIIDRVGETQRRNQRARG